MSTNQHITISAKPSEKDSMNFDALKKTGLDYIQRVAGKIWTDFNVHDPGLTTLEILCYAISDLGYRANFDIKDLVATDPQSNAAPTFFTARQVLTNAPFTVNDYRKLLIDVDGVKNAWLDIATESEVDFYVDRLAKEITYTPTETTDKITLNGLYKVLLELDESEKFGDLNDNNLSRTIEIEAGDLQGLLLQITVEFPY